MLGKSLEAYHKNLIVRHWKNRHMLERRDELVFWLEMLDEMVFNHCTKPTTDLCLMIILDLINKEFISSNGSAGVLAGVGVANIGINADVAVDIAKKRQQNTLKR